MTEFPPRPGPHDTVVVRPKGRLDMALAPALRQELTALIESGKIRLVVDMNAVDTIDSSALGSLVAILKIARQAGGDLRLVAPSRQVAEELNMTNLVRVMPPYPSVESAFAV
ncbi:MAG: STAS domain-containing protein [Mycobacterium sp.]